MNFRITFILLLYLGLSTILMGQNPQIILGRILDKTDTSPVEYASITLYNTADSSLITGVVSDIEGRFQIEQKLSKPAFISVQFLGYETYYATIEKTGTILDLGDILLNVSSAVLEAVEVTGRKLTSLHQLDKQVFDAEQFENAKGGTAMDILRNLPAVTVNPLGEISVRGTTGFIVMINGKPVQTDPSIILGQLNANAIEDIEVITAPSAKYDPDGKAGIINIKTRQNATDGIYLMANVLVGLPSIEPYDNGEAARRYGADVTLNVKRDKWDISFGMDYRRNDVSGRRIGYVNTYIDEVLTEFPSYGERSFDREQYAGRLSLSYSPNTASTLTTSFYAGKRTQDRRADILYDNQQRSIVPSESFLDPEAYWDLYDTNGSVFSGGTVFDQLSYFNENLRVRRGDFFIGSVDYSITFQNESSLSFSALYERTILGGPTDNVNLAWPLNRDTLQLQFNDNDNPLDGVRLQVNYQQKIGTAQWENGYQYRYLKHPGDFIYLDRNFQTNTWETNPLFTNSIDLQRDIHSVYSQIGGSAGKWQYSFGLRLEYFDRSVGLANPNTAFELKQFNPFPSANLRYDLGDGLSAKMAYSRRIERTTTFKMTPFPEREHSETLEQGDAELNPEFIDLVELGLVKNWEENSLFATAYFRNVNNVINRVNSIFNDTILNRIYTNAGKAEAIGLEIGTTLYPSKGWRLTLGTNIFNYSIKGQLLGDEINTSNTIYSINANNNFKLSSSFDLQIGINYLSERVTAQGRDSRFYNPFLSMKKSFADKKWAITLQWLNIDMGLLSSNEQRITTVRDNFFTTTNYVYEVDILQLSFSYQLNQPSKKMKFINSEFGAKEF